MSDLSSGRDPVEALAEEFLERKRRGERPTMDEYVREYPELAADIRDLFPALLALEDLKPAADSSDSLAESRSKLAAEPVLEQLGDYRIIREVGRGGMGVVYEAEQMSLGRHVALKVLPRQLVSNPKIQQRFEREARAAARLHHTNIVPVYGVGEHEGTPYYAMQFIQGLGLDAVLLELRRLPLDSSASGLRSGQMRITRRPEALAEEVARSRVSGQFTVPESDEDPERDPNLTCVTGEGVALTEATGQRARDPLAGLPRAVGESSIASDASSTSSIILPGKSGLNPHGNRREPTYWNSVAQIGWQIAQALQYAHDQGVLHRDIKPGNLMLDLRGTIWVTDFGLAKANDAQNLTEQGDILGTLRYMPPEVFQGQTDVRGDVYSLGLTLYELLTFEPAFQENDRHKLIRQLTANTPTKIEKLKPKVPRDLATIVTKAIERDPSHRYQTAKELADDLQRFLDDQPVHARRISLAERLGRWSRRNKGLAASLAVLAVMLLVINIAGPIFTWRIARLNTALRDSQARLSSTVDELTVATEDLTVARNEAANESVRNLQLAQQSETARVEAEAARQEAEAQRGVAFRTLYFAKATTVSDALARPSGRNDIDRFLAEWRGTVIDRDPRAWEWSYLNSPSPYEHMTLQGHGVDCLTVAWSPDGKCIASGGWSDTIRLWDAETARHKGVIPNSGSSLDLCWSPDSRHIAESVYPNAIKVWDTATGRQRFTLTLQSSGSHRAGWSPDGQLIATREQSGVIRLWEAGQGQPVRELEQSDLGDKSGGRTAWSPDGQRIAGVGVDGINIWNIADGKLMRTLGPLSVIHANALAWSADGSRIAVAGEEQAIIEVWDVASGTAERSLRGHTSGINSIAWSPDSSLLASASKDQTVRVWNIEAAQPEIVLTGHKFGVNGVSWKPDGTQLASAGGGWNGEVKVWRFDRSVVSTIPCVEGLHRQIGVAWAPRGNRLAVAADHGKVEVWNLDTGEKSTVVEGGAFWPNILCWNPDGTELAISVNRLDDALQETAAATIYDVGSAQERVTLAHGPGHITTISWSADGKHLLTGLSVGNTQDTLIRQWDTATGQVVKSFLGMGAAWSPDGKRFAILRSYAVVIYDADSGRPLVHWSHPSQVHHEMCWSPDGKYLAVPFGSSVDIWETGTGRLVKALPGHTDWSVVAWSPDGERLVTGSGDGTLRIWDVSSASLVLMLPGHKQPVAGLAWSADGLRIASAGYDRTIRIWDATGGALRDYVPALLPTVDARIAADSQDTAALRTRAIVRARNEDWAGAAADFDQLIKLLGERTPNCFTTGWWSLPSLPADTLDPFFPAESDGSASRLPARPGWYSHADDPNGFVPLPVNPPVLITRMYAAAEGDVVVRSSRFPLKLRFNGQHEQTTTLIHVLALRKGWNTLVVELENREEIFQLLTRPNAGLFASISGNPADVVAAQRAGGDYEKAVEVAEEALRKSPRDVAILRLTFRAYERYLEELDRRRTPSWKTFLRRLVSPSQSKTDGEAVAEEFCRARARMIEILGLLAVQDPQYDVSSEILVQCLDWTRVDSLETATIGDVTVQRRPNGAISTSGDHVDHDLHTLISPQDVSTIRAFTAVGLIRLLTAQYQPAADWLESAAAESRGDGREELLLLALAYERLGRPADARKALQAALDEPDPPVDDKLLVHYLLLVAVSDALRSAPEDTELLRRRAAVLSQLGRAAEELSDLNALAKLNPDDPELIAAIGDLYCVTQDWERAIGAYSSLINEQTRDAELLAKRAEAYDRAGQREQSNADWARAVELNPEDARLRQRRVAMLEASEQWAELAADYSQQLDRLPESRRHYQPRSQLIATVIRRRDPVFAALQDLRSDDSLLDVALGRDCAVRSDWSRAASFYPQDIDRTPDPEEWYECAAALLLAGRQDEYRALLKRMMERSEKADDPFMAFAVARAAAISPQEVMPWPEVVWRAELAARQPNAPPWYSHVAGLARFRAGEQDKALTWLQQSAANTWHPELNQIALCLVYGARGEFDKARDYLEQVRQWLADKQANRRNGYYAVQSTDWLELHLLLLEAEALIEAKVPRGADALPAK